MLNIQITPLLDTLKLCDISDEEYFGKEYTDYVSNSRLKLINPEEDGSPAKYFAKSETVFTDSLYFGSCVHQMILQPDDFELVESVNRPTAKMGFMADELFKLYKQGVDITDEDVISASDKISYYKGKMDDKKIRKVREDCAEYWKSRLEFETLHSDSTKEFIYLDVKSREKLKLCLESVNKNKKIQDLLHPSGITEDPISLNELNYSIGCSN